MCNIALIISVPSNIIVDFHCYFQINIQYIYIYINWLRIVYPNCFMILTCVIMKVTGYIISVKNLARM